MAVLNLFIGNKVDSDKCYTFSFSIENNPGGSIKFQLFFGTTEVFNMGTYNAIGDYAVDFDGQIGAQNLTPNRLIITTVAPFTIGDIIAMQIKLNPSCAENTICSECFDYATCHVGSKLDIRYTNNETGLGFNYSTFPITRQILVKGGLRNEDFPYPTEEYFTDSKGESFPIFVYSKETVEAIIEECPAYMHAALRLAFVHDQLFINGKPYVKESGSYSPDWSQDSLLAPVIVKVSEKIQTTYNDNC